MYSTKEVQQNYILKGDYKIMKYSGTETNGIYSNSYTQEVDKSLKYCKYGQCGIIELCNGKLLKSYTSSVLTWYNGGDLVVHCMYSWSRTTQNHIKAFLREYIPTLDYKTLKQLYNDGMIYNTLTGEVTPIENTIYYKRA